jgi:hypothetical protein
MLFAVPSSGIVNSVIRITGIGDRDRPEWLIRISGMRNLRPRKFAKKASITRLPMAKSSASVICVSVRWVYNQHIAQSSICQKSINLQRLSIVTDMPAIGAAGGNRADGQLLRYSTRTARAGAKRRDRN